MQIHILGGKSMHELWNIRSEIASLEAYLKELKKEYGLPIADGVRKSMLRTTIQMTEARLINLKRSRELRLAYIQTENALREYKTRAEGS
jgi:hypothetical protein